MNRSQIGFIDVAPTGEFTGSFLEEGYAEYERGQYVKQLGHKDGVLTEDLVLLEDFMGRDKVGAHYFWVAPDNAGGVFCQQPYI